MRVQRCTGRRSIWAEGARRPAGELLIEEWCGEWENGQCGGNQAACEALTMMS